MQNIQKREKQYFKDFLFKRVNFVPSLTLLYGAIIFINILCDGIVILQYVVEDTYSFKNFGAPHLFYLSIGLLIVFVLISIGSIFSRMFRHIWMYYLMILQSLTFMYVRNTMICISSISSQFCKEELQIKIGSLITLVFFCLIIMVLKNNAYYPFINITNLFSMRQQNVSIFLLMFRIILGFILYHDAFSNRTNQIRAIFIIAFILFCKTRNSGYCNQLSKKIWNVYYYFICWTSLSLFFAQYLNLINDPISLNLFGRHLSFKEMVMYFWIYTFPFVISIPICFSSSIGPQFWKNIFLVSSHQIQQIYQRHQIYIICNQLYNLVNQIKESEMKFKDPLYKQLCQLILKHNQNCQNLICPLNQLQFKVIQNQDLYSQQRSFTKTLNLTLQFVRKNLQKLREKYSTSLQVKLQIAYFYLVSLKNKQKSLQLYNQFFSKKNKNLNVQRQSANLKQNHQNFNGQKKKKRRDNQKQNNKQKGHSFSQIYAINFLKRMTDVMLCGQSKQNQTNVDNQISQFRQKIEISVTMLAEFWSLLADSKCNLKKLYQITNLLYPLRLNIEKDWQKVRLFKNTETYCIYAKYLVKMFNDKQKGIKIMDEVQKIQQQAKNKQNIQLQDKRGQLIQQNAIIFMEYDGKNSGIIFQTNVNAEKMFGYSKNQLINHKVNQIMPHIYSEQHDKILQNYIQTNYSAMNKQRSMWAKSKDGFIFPILMVIKPVFSHYSKASSIQVYASIKRESYLRQTIAFVLNQKQEVQQFTSTALGAFPLLHKKYQEKNKRKNIFYKLKNDGFDKNPKAIPDTFLAADLIQNYQQLKNKILIQNQQCEYKIRRTFKLSRLNALESQSYFQEQCIYNFQLSQVIIKVTGKIGYIIKLIKQGSSQFVKKQIQNKQKEGTGSDDRNNIKSRVLVQVKQNNLYLSQQKNIQQLKKQNYFNPLVKINHNNAINQQQKKKKKNIQKQSSFQIKQLRKFIFSYDVFQKQKTFQRSLKQIKQSIKSINQQNQNEQNYQKKFTQKNLKNEYIKQSISRHQNQLSLTQKNNLMKFLGGYTRCNQILDKIHADTLNTFKNQLKVSEMQCEQNRIDFSNGIKTKRLFENMIRQMRQQSEYQFNNEQKQDQKQGTQKQYFLEVKPSQVSTILQKSSKNKIIFNLRILTIILLISCSIVSITQYILIKQNRKDIMNKLKNIRTLCQLKTEVYSLNYFVNYMSLFQGEDTIMNYSNMKENINQLDNKINNFQFKKNCQIKYNDGSVQTYFIGFALNKLISSANFIQLNANGLVNMNGSGQFFVRYNSINGISNGLSFQQDNLWQQYDKLLSSLSFLGLVFIIVSSSISFVFMIVKIILLRLVTNKKQQILEIFFQIPRISCNIIQKQCEQFILRITSDNQDEQNQITNFQFELEDGNRNGHKAQKKRSIVGSQNSIISFIIACCFCLFFLLFYQLYYQITQNIRENDFRKLSNCTQNFLNLQYKLFEVPVFIESSAIDKTMPIQNQSNHLKILSQIELLLQDKVSVVRQDIFEALRQLDQQFVNSITQMFYQKLCDDDKICDQSSNGYLNEQNKGLNSVIAKFLEIIKIRFKQFQNQIQQSLSSSSTSNNFTDVKKYQQGMKKYWRQFTQQVLNAIQRYLYYAQIISLWILVLVCVLNLTIFMIIWLRYYWNLEQKILATEYMLTFIPIDQINKNNKIAAFIKKQVLNRR